MRSASVPTGNFKVRLNDERPTLLSASCLHVVLLEAVLDEESYSLDFVETVRTDRCQDMLNGRTKWLTWHPEQSYRYGNRTCQIGVQVRYLCVGTLAGHAMQSSRPFRNTCKIVVPVQEVDMPNRPVGKSAGHLR